MTEIAQFYKDFRIATLTISGVSTLLFGIEIFRDRQATLQRLQGKGKDYPIHMKGVLRFAVALYSLIFFIGAWDNAGVFGIYSVELIIFRSAWLAFLSAGVSGFAFTRALIAAFPFIFGNRREAKRQVYIGMTAFVIVFSLGITTSETIQNRVYQVFASLLLLVLLTIFIGIVLATYVALLRHHNFLIANRNKASDSNSREFRNLLRQVKRWRYFSVLAMLAYVGISVSFVLELINDIKLLGVPEVEVSIEALYFIRPEVPPPGAPFDSLSIETYAGLLIIYAVLWYTWGWRDVRPVDSLASSRPSKESTSSESITSVRKKGNKNKKNEGRPLSPTSSSAPKADIVMDIRGSASASSEALSASVGTPSTSSPPIKAQLA